MENKLLRLNKKKLLPFKTSSKVKNAIKEWYKKYQLGELEDEVRNYLNFENIILKNLLDYKQNDFEFEYPLDGRSVEFMILKDNKPYIAIELKGTKTKDLTRKYGEKYSAVEQASNYASKKSSIEWYIVSNYYEFRLYNKKSQNKYISFNLDDLKPNGFDFDEERIQQFLNCFSRVSILEKNYLNKLYDSKGLFPEDFNLENEFYKLYNETRLMIIKELEENNQLKRENSIEYAQLILNRYIFTCFSEDKGLLPDNLTTDEILTPIRRKVLSISTIWSRLNELFYFINNGNPDNNITGYNGGLFKEDLGYLRIRDKIEDTNFYDDIKVKWSFPEQEHIIDHELRNYPNINQIYRNLLIISSFDFETDLTENILGHIFENSISDLEELKNEKESKRKKEGVYYTPEYITKYICENTIIPYLSNENSATLDSLIKEYSNNLEELETKLHDIKILDPACGSGAFLNKATDTLLNIHKAIFKLKHENSDNLDKEFDNIDNRRDILLNNIYGVDLNHESIEITKLGLFLKVCKKGIKLPDLDKNIKCGNSLIEDFKYTERPFQWEIEFSEIFKNGGFDILIGNPPYVRQEKIIEIKPYLKDNYEVYAGMADLYVYFFEKGLNLLKEEGYLGLICSNKYTRANYGKKLREKLLKYNITNYNDFTGGKVFADATVDPSVIIINKNQKQEKNILINNEFLMNQKHLDNGSWSFEAEEVLKLKEKVMKKGIRIKDIGEININRGILTGFNDAFIINEKTKNQLIKEDSENINIIKPLIRGRDIKKWGINYKNIYLIFTRRGININNYPSILKYLSKYKKELTPKKDSKEKIGRKPGKYKWYEIQDVVAYHNEFEKDKIIYPELSEELFTILDNNKFYVDKTGFILTVENRIDLKYISLLLSSKLLNFLFKKIGATLGKRGYNLSKIFIEQLPIIITSKDEQKPFIDLATEIIDKNKVLHDEIESFHKYLVSDFNVSKINKKLTEYYSLSFDDLYKEVKKQYKQITRQEKDKLEKEYILSMEIIEPLQKEIKSIDKEIDKLVYELYNLNDEEIKIIEKSV